MGKRVLLGLFDAVFGVITIIPVLLAVGGFFAARVHPDRCMELQWMGLFLTLLLAINLLLMLYWIARRKGWFLFPLVALLLNIPYLSGVVRWPYKQAEPVMSEVSLATYNIRYGANGGLNGTIPYIARFMQEEGVDILCLQEFPAINEEQVEIVEELFDFLPYQQVYSSSSDMHIALFSRFPILDSSEIFSPGESNARAAWVDIEIHGEVVRVVNTHLQTTNLNQNRRRFLKKRNIEPSDIIRVKDMMDQNSITRANQADLLREEMDKSPYPLVVCGDFNDTPASYVYRKIKGDDLNDGFRSAGKGYGYTYRYLWKLFRIDYILYSNNVFEAVHYSSPDLEYSDHKPVIVHLNFKLPVKEGRNQK